MPCVRLHLSATAEEVRFARAAITRLSRVPTASGGTFLTPQLGAFVIYAAIVVLLIAFPAGLYGRRR